MSRLLPVMVPLMVRAAALGAVALGLVATARPAAAGPEGKDFIAEARVFHRVVACGNDDPLPAGFDAKIVDAHCADLRARITRYRDKFMTPARTFLAGVRPAGLPTMVVYPFGGGDLVSALITYPDAREITTMSLEHPGDPTRLAGLTPGKLRSSLRLFRDSIRGLLINNDSASVNMMKMERGPIPGQLAFFMTGLTVLDYEPVALRYFTLDDAGGVVYLDDAAITALAPKKARKKKGSWVDTDYSEAFTSMELTFRRRGDASAPLITHRHFAANLGDEKFRGSPLERHLVAKGKVAAMTKAASYLLWINGFSGIRDYLLGNLVWMISDSTGIPPRHARKAGMVQTTYGRFAGSFLGANQTDNEAFRKLWRTQPYRKLPFRFGYPDSAGRFHMMTTAPAATP